MLAGLKPQDMQDQDLMQMVKQTIDNFQQNKVTDNSALARRITKYEKHKKVTMMKQARSN